MYFTVNKLYTVRFENISPLPNLYTLYLPRILMLAVKDDAG